MAAGRTAGTTGGVFCVVVSVGASLDAVLGMPRGVWALGLTVWCIPGLHLIPFSFLADDLFFSSTPPSPFFTHFSISTSPFFCVLVLPWHTFCQWSDVPVPCVGYNNPELQVWCWFRLVNVETLTRLQWGDNLPYCRLKCQLPNEGSGSRPGFW